MSTQPKSAGVYLRPDSALWQVRFRVRGKTYRRSVRATTKAGAVAGREAYRKQIERRGDPIAHGQEPAAPKQLALL